MKRSGEPLSVELSADSGSAENAEPPRIPPLIFSSQLPPKPDPTELSPVQPSHAAEMEPVESKRPASEPPVTEPSVTEPPITQPPITQPGTPLHGVAPPPVVPQVASDNVPVDSPNAAPHVVTSPRRRWRSLPWRIVNGGWEVVSVYVLLASVAAIPVVQFASLGYLLHSAGRLAQGQPWRSCLPGAHTAGRITMFVLLAAILWLPVWLVTDLSYSAQLLQPGSRAALAWRIGAFTITLAWIGHVTWAAMRGGRWWHFVWPAPVRFLLQSPRPSTWKHASDQLYELVEGLQLPTLWWLGLRAALGAILWTSVPVSMMIIGLRAQDAGAAGVVGLIGAVAMGIIMLYLPFMQVQLAATGQFRDVFNVREVRRRFAAAPLAHATALLLLCALSIPLYVLRIEATPAELLWAPSLVFVLFMMPAKWMIGASMGYADSRRKAAGALPYPSQWSSTQEKKAQLRLGRRGWFLRWPAQTIALASVTIYVGSLYVAQLVAGQGAWVMYFQHAVLVPAPLISS